mmetsp:Transcript_61055/g.132355  ORF Transcript_61055/g.132355 Transcript_61055/m.132355 type:complete len:247 (-) Transcript_61055:97-837(-)
MGPPANELLQNFGHVRREPKWSFNSRPLSKLEPSPGPHVPVDVHRDAHGKFIRNPAFSFGKVGYRDRDRPASAPGPGEYKASDAVRPRPPSWGFGSTRRSGGRDFGHTTPGPGDYVPGSGTPGRGLGNSRGPKWHASRNGEALRPETPGPCHYRPASPGGPTRATWWGHAPTMLSNDGPCSARGKGLGGVYGRPSSSGPGYTYNGIGSGPKWSMAPRRYDEEQTTPGRAVGANHRDLGGPWTQFGY